MKKTIIINEEVETTTEMVNLLKYISNLIDEGYTRGFYPTWRIENIVEEEE